MAGKNKPTNLVNSKKSTVIYLPYNYRVIMHDKLWPIPDWVSGEGYINS